MLDQQMRSAYLSLRRTGDAAGLELRGGVCGRAVVGCHVGFYFGGVGAGGGFPARFFGAGVEVVGEVFGVGVPNFPLGGEAGFGGGLWGKRMLDREVVVGVGGCVLAMVVMVIV